ncbi:hypothetical protein ACFWP3_37715 [Streptomyces sp. NPDC058525]|uniref:hypothetical protein n=1 Tax=unclassified Streptomyces TaxID=2593676 RepID=UPI00365E1BD1
MLISRFRSFTGGRLYGTPQPLIALPSRPPTGVALGVADTATAVGYGGHER